MTLKRWLLLAVLLAAVAAFFAFDLRQYLSLDTFMAQRARLDALVAQHPLGAPLTFFALYVAVAALSIPGAAVMTLIGGALFGVALGTLLVSFASAIGATLAFLIARLLLGEWVQRRYRERLRALNDGVERDGPLYLATLRLVVVFPFWLVNILMGLTKIPVRTFYWVSQLAMLPATLVYVFAGSKLGEFRVSPGLLVALALLAVFPWLARWLAATLKTRKVMARWAAVKPARYDYNLVVIGAGSAGLVSAYIGAATKARVALVEQHKMGGDCLNTGCVPSKALIRSAKLLSQFARAPQFGIETGPARVDFAAVMQRVQRVIGEIEPHDSVARYSALGVDCIAGRARITTPWSVEVATNAGPRVLTTRSIVIAAGARPFVPPIPGLEEVGYFTSDTVWNLRALPRRLVVLGGGPIGCELAQAFARLGAEVQQVEMLPRLLVREDEEVSQQARRALEADGVRVLTGHTAAGRRREDPRRRERRQRSATCLRRSAGGGRARCQHQRLRPGRTRHRDHARPHRRHRRGLADDLSEHHCLRRCGRSLPVHAHRGAPGLVCGGKCAVRRPAPIQGRLPRDSVGDVYRSGDRARRPQRAGSAREEHPARRQRLWHRRPRPRDHRW
jgi:uncharacterized membrane protein YdjX (TVP38/TMEM64 family)/thioredoxin reductase